MPTFGPRSKQRLATCHPLLQQVCNRGIEIVDFSIISGRRDKAEQDNAFETGRSTVRWPRSKHNANPSLAVDVAPWPIDWENTERFSFLAGLLMGIGSELSIVLRWGGDWDRDGIIREHRFIDMPHLEIADAVWDDELGWVL